MAQASGFRDIPRDDAWHSIPSPGGAGSLLCGLAANKRILELARDAGAHAGILRRVKISTLREAIASQLTKRFLIDQRSINAREIDRLKASAGREAAKTLRSDAHWIPCHLMLTKDPESIVIGPVEFINRKKFRSLLLSKIATYKKDIEPDRKKYLRKWLSEAITYYRQFQWVAQVTVERCERDVAEIISHRAVLSALDCIHLLLGGQWTDRMRVAGPGLRWDKRSYLRIDAGGFLLVSTSTRGAGQVAFPDGWSTRLGRPEYVHLLHLFGTALVAAVDPDCQRPLSRRFLDAAQWFGEAARDESNATATVKYVTSIERMVMTNEKDDVTKLVVDRVGAICFQVDDRGIDKWRGMMSDLYDMRSKLVHGAASPLEDWVWRGRALGREIAETVLLQTLLAWGQEGLEESECSTRRLAKWFRAVCERADAYALANR